MEILSPSSATDSTDTPGMGEPAPPPSPASGQGETNGQGESPAHTPSHPIVHSSDDDDGDGRDPADLPLVWTSRALDSDFGSLDTEDLPLDRLTAPSASLDTEDVPLDRLTAPSADELLDDASSVVESMLPFAAPAAASDNVPDPKSFKQATGAGNPYAADWKIASDIEIEAHWENGTWTLVPLPFGRKAIGCTWVYKTKRGKSGEIVKRKARLCFRGDYQAVFAPTVK